MTPIAEPAPDFAAANEPRASARAEPRFSRDLPISDALRDAARSWTVVTALCLGVWLLVRMVFFVGLEGSDDMFYLRYACLWHRAPVNQWEVRLLGNALISASVRLFGYHEWAAALPSLCASLTILLTVLAACRNLGTVGQAWWAGLLTATLPVEVTNATIISAHAVMAGFMAPGTLAFVLAPESTLARRVAAVCLPLGVVSHLNGAYYAAALLAAALIVD